MSTTSLNAAIFLMWNEAAFHLPVRLEEASKIKELDRRIRVDEARALMPEADWAHGEPLGCRITGWAPREAELRFLRCWDRERRKGRSLKNAESG